MIQQQPYIVCPKCGMVSHHPMDVKERYCGNCHAFHDDLMRTQTRLRVGKDPKAVIEEFCRMARPLMRRFMPADSCIGSGRTTIEVMRLFGIEAVPLAVSFVFQVPAREYARLSGIPKDEQEEMKAKSKTWIDLSDDGWQGHLLVLAADRWVLDPAFDQADAPQFGVHVPSEIFFFDALGQEWNPREKFEMQLDLVMDNGDNATLYYRRLADESYRDTDAWNDEGLPLLAQAIAAEMGSR